VVVFPVHNVCAPVLWKLRLTVLDPGFAVTIATPKLKELKAKQSSIKKAIAFNLTFVTNRKIRTSSSTKKRGTIRPLACAAERLRQPQAA
jgi:hypothetical protein